MSKGATAIIVARGGSVRLPGKALLPFGGSTLVGHKVDTLWACPLIERVIVGSDSDVILAEGERHGAQAIKRQPYHCDESRCSANEMIADMVGRIDGVDEDVVVWAHSTNPLVTADTYQAAIAHYAASRCDSLLSVTPVRRHAWMNGAPINYDPSAECHTVAADCTAIYLQDGAIFIQTLRRWRETSYFVGASPQLFVIDAWEGIDIDTEDDYQQALRIYETRKGQNY